MVMSEYYIKKLCNGVKGVSRMSRELNPRQKKGIHIGELLRVSEPLAVCLYIVDVKFRVVGNKNAAFAEFKEFGQYKVNCLRSRNIRVGNRCKLFDFIGNRPLGVNKYREAVYYIAFLYFNGTYFDYAVVYG